LMKDMEPYYECSLTALVEIETQLDSFFRSSWSAQADYEIYADQHFAIIDHSRKRRIFFLYGLRLPITEDIGLNYSQQIFEHWILGETRDRKTKTKAVRTYLKRNKYLSETMLSLFAKGSRINLIEQRNAFELPDQPPEYPDWEVLHHPIGCTGIKSDFIDIILEADTSFPKYEVWLAYGVVSRQHFQRTDKRQIARVLRSLLKEHNFDPDDVHMTQDCGRNYEPVLLWCSHEEILDTSMHVLMGINYGYDNGRSSYRLGIGLFIEEENLFLKQLNLKALANYDKFSGFHLWDHHQERERFEAHLESFFDQHYNRITHNISELINRSKAFTFYSRDSSLHLLLNTHQSTFEKERDDLARLHDIYTKRHGYCRYAHILAWSKLAKELIDKKGRKSSVADFIASSILGWKSQQKRRH
ncbi:MAG: hypothetical protein AB8G77_04605, partial [Rhodothermales bacterium]